MGNQRLTRVGSAKKVGFSPAPLSPISLVGHVWDTNAHLYFAPYRYQDADFGRWSVRDPIGISDGPNLYAYGKARVVTGFDPDGLSCLGSAGNGVEPFFHNESRDSCTCVCSLGHCEFF